MSLDRLFDTIPAYKKDTLKSCFLNLIKTSCIKNIHLYTPETWYEDNKSFYTLILSKPKYAVIKDTSLVKYSLNGFMIYPGLRYYDFYNGKVPEPYYDAGALHMDTIKYLFAKDIPEDSKICIKKNTIELDKTEFNQFWFVIKGNLNYGKYI